MSFTIAPVHWKVAYLVKQGPDLIHAVALQAAGTTTAYRLVVGRCLLAMDRIESYREFGCSGSIHYARKVLGLSQPTANSFRWVARRLEELPRLTIAAEEGSISWCKLRLLVRKASAETEVASDKGEVGGEGAEEVASPGAVDTAPDGSVPPTEVDPGERVADSREVEAEAVDTRQVRERLETFQAGRHGSHRDDCSRAGVCDPIPTGAR